MPIPVRHWRTYGDYPLPIGAEALEEPFNAFPSWFLRITCDRCGKVQMVNQVSSRRCATTAAAGEQGGWKQQAGAEDRAAGGVTDRLVPAKVGPPLGERRPELGSWVTYDTPGRADASGVPSHSSRNVS